MAIASPIEHLIITVIMGAPLLALAGMTVFLVGRGGEKRR